MNGAHYQLCAFASFFSCDKWLLSRQLTTVVYGTYRHKKEGVIT